MRGSTIVTLGMLAIFATMVGVSFTYPEGARFMPLVVGLPAIGLCLLQIFLDLRSKPQREAAGDGGNVFAKGESEIARMTGRDIKFEVTQDQPLVVETQVSEAEAQRREIISWLFFIGAVGGVLLFGFWVTLPLFIFLFLLTMARMKWTRALFAAVFAGVALHLVFVEGLRVPLHNGFVTEIVLKQFGIS